MSSFSDENRIDKLDARPSFGAEYRLWLEKVHLLNDLDKYESHYKVVSARIAEVFKGSVFWGSVIEEMRNIDASYIMKNKYPLIRDQEPKVVLKSWESFLNKTFRKNVLYNENWPLPPASGWILPPDWFCQINDIVRTSIVVRYIDGVPLVLNKLRQLAIANHVDCDAELISRDDGYYGAHSLCQVECEILSLDWKKLKIKPRVEIQITTQMKDIFKTLLHSFYEDSRNIPDARKSIESAAWNYKSDEFIARYLGHILHYVEGMIIEVRDRRGGVR